MTAPTPLTVITGGGRGIGAATALRLAEEGHDLVLGYRSDAAAAERVAAEVGRVGEPEEIAAAIVWLLGDACPYATGATLRVAGGR